MRWEQHRVEANEVDEGDIILVAGVALKVTDLRYEGARDETIVFLVNEIGTHIEDELAMIDILRQVTE